VLQWRRNSEPCALSQPRVQVAIHPSSVLFRKKTITAVVFSDVIVTTKNYMRTVSAVEMAWLPGTIACCGGLHRVLLSCIRINCRGVGGDPQKWHRTCSVERRPRRQQPRIPLLLSW
jgi:hypothetical protein